jgi:hypothetical protein
MKMNKNRLHIVLVGLSVIIVTILLSVLILCVINHKLSNSSNHNKSSQTDNTGKPTKTSADQLMEEAKTAITSGDSDKAKGLLGQAIKQYTSLNDAPAVTDAQAQLYTIEHQSTTKPTLDSASASGSVK